MDSKVVAFELQDDNKVKKQPVSLTFPRQNDGCLYVITNQKSKCHFCQDPEEQKSLKKAPPTGKERAEKLRFQYGVSTKVFSVTGPTVTQWEVRLLLSPSEISRLSSAFNLIGCFSSYLVSSRRSADGEHNRPISFYNGKFSFKMLGIAANNPEGPIDMFVVSKGFRDAFKELLHGKRSEDAAKEICKAIAPFLCLPEGGTIRDFHTQLGGMVKQTIIESCMGLPGEEAMMVAGGLAVLLAAELAASLGDSKAFDYTGEKTEGQENLNDQIQQMVQMSNIQTEHLVVPHRQKNVHVIFRNPCPDNWASGGRKSIASGETFEFGLCHKVFSISEAQSEIQFLQSLQESYDMIAVFHIAAFAKHLLETKKWRKALEVLLKEGQKQETIKELSQLAVQFVCSMKFNTKIFLKSFGKELAEKVSKVQTLPVGGEAICVLGLLVATMAALKAKAIAENQTDDISSDEDTDQPVAPKDQTPEVAPDCDKIGLPNAQEGGHPTPETIGQNSEESGRVNEEAATDNKGGIARDLADGREDKRVDFVEQANVENDKTGSPRIPGVGAPDTGTLSPCLDDVPHPCLKEDHFNQNRDSNPYLLSSSNVETCGPLASPDAADPQGSLEIPSNVITLGTCNDGSQDPDDVNAYYPGSSVDRVISGTTVGRVHDPDSGQWADWPNFAKDPNIPTPKLQSSSKDTEETINRDRQITGRSEPPTFNSQIGPSPQKSQETEESDIDKLDQRPVQPPEVVLGGGDTSHRPVDTSLFSLPLIILIVAMILASLMLPSWFKSILFTGVLLLLGVRLFMTRGP